MKISSLYVIVCVSFQKGTLTINKLTTSQIITKFDLKLKFDKLDETSVIRIRTVENKIMHQLNS